MEICGAAFAVRNQQVERVQAAIEVHDDYSLKPTILRQGGRFSDFVRMLPNQGAARLRLPPCSQDRLMVRVRVRVEARARIGVQGQSPLTQVARALLGALQSGGSRRRYGIPEWLRLGSEEE